MLRSGPPGFLVMVSETDAVFLRPAEAFWLEITKLELFACLSRLLTLEDACFGLFAGGCATFLATLRVSVGGSSFQGRGMSAL